MAPPQMKLSWYFKLMGVTALKLHRTTKIAKRTCYSIVNGNAFPTHQNLLIIHQHYPQISLNYLFSE